MLNSGHQSIDTIVYDLFIFHSQQQTCAAHMMQPHGQAADPSGKRDPSPFSVQWCHHAYEVRDPYGHEPCLRAQRHYGKADVCRLYRHEVQGLWLGLHSMLLMASSPPTLLYVRLRTNCPWEAPLHASACQMHVTLPIREGPPPAPLWPSL